MATKLAAELGVDSVINGGSVDRLPTDVTGHDLVVWMPDVPNDEEKAYPTKSQGSILVCSKVMRDGYTKAQAVARIFAMHGNAVIRIQAGTRPFGFILTDALGNNWAMTTSIADLADGIRRLTDWTLGGKRVGARATDRARVHARSPIEAGGEDLDRLIACTRDLADRIENGIGSRYFGNVATRCQQLFPGMAGGVGMLVSPRNSDKRRIEAADMAFALKGIEGVEYHGKKPSVDAPVQLELFEARPDINFFVHGHAYVVGAPLTEHYYPCGDLREVPDILALMDGPRGIINLRNHGFLAFSDSIDALRDMTDGLSFEGASNDTTCV